MTWYAAHDRNHELIGTLHVDDRSMCARDLQERKIARLTGMERLRIGDFDPSVGISPDATSKVFHVIVKLEEVWSEKRVLFSYVTLLNEENPVAHPAMDPELDWIGATFVPLGAPLMCERCPDRNKA